ncbi:MAG: NUDIX hydrolase [Elusimicrobia bacterium]|nr:NUDIX hydrolase [Elusimicrobiota bacterium]
MSKIDSPNKKEYSAGGVIVDCEKLLIILMNTLGGRKIWTFPKGHLEKDETAESAAIRETREETGYNCRIVKKIFKTHYSFFRNGFKIDKTVDWFVMEKIGERGKVETPEEISDLKWLSINEAEKILTYASDLKIINFLRDKNV